MNIIALIRRALFELPLKEAEFDARKFENSGAAQERLEMVAKTVVTGYNVAIAHGYNRYLLDQRGQVKEELLGFFTEGVGMGLYTLDLFSLGSGQRFWDFVSQEGKHHQYMSYIGAGLASGVFNKDFKAFVDQASPTSGLLILNGIGFYNAYFRSKKTIGKAYVPNSVRADDFYLYCYDNGIGRALWFYTAGDPVRIHSLIERFPVERRKGLWAGVGLAATYACGVGEKTLIQLKRIAEPWQAGLAQGSVLASHTRHVAGNPHHDDKAAHLLVGRSSLECNAFAVQAKEDLQGQRHIDGQHSLQVFLNAIEQWTQTVTQPTSVAIPA